MNTFWYRSINSTLRCLPKITYDEFKRFGPFCYLMQTYFRKKTPSTDANIPTIVYRSVQLIDEQIQPYKQTDNCFQFTSFISTSKNKDVTEKFSNVLLIFDLNVLNSRSTEMIRFGAYIGPYSNFSDEEEFLLIWPLTIFTVDKYEFNHENGKHLIYLKLSTHPKRTADNIK